MNWIFLKSTWKGLLENAQDGISRKLRKSINKSRNSFGGHPVFSDIFKIKDQKQTEIVNILQNLLKLLGLIFQNVIALVKIWHILW